MLPDPSVEVGLNSAVEVGLNSAVEVGLNSAVEVGLNSGNSPVSHPARINGDNKSNRIGNTDIRSIFLGIHSPLVIRSQYTVDKNDPGSINLCQLCIRIPIVFNGHPKNIRPYIFDSQ
jgi:hypothetical protein